MNRDDVTAVVEDNPFFVLDVSPDASRAEIERVGQKLLHLLALESTSASTYATPVGPRARTADLVRAAMDRLRDPAKRVVCEAWARSAWTLRTTETLDHSPRWSNAFLAIGWNAR